VVTPHAQIRESVTEKCSGEKMADYVPFKGETAGNPEEGATYNIVGTAAKVGDLPVSAALSDILSETNTLRTTANYDNDFDIYDDMLKLDPELNGAVRAISLSANDWGIDYTTGKNRRIRNAIRELVEETLDFDDILINAMRNMMVYGNDINKLSGKMGVGLTNVQSLPAKQITIVDERAKIDASRPFTAPFVADEANPIIENKFYVLREQQQTEQAWSKDEIWHLRIDYRSNWFEDKLGRKSYGIWGASRFSSLKQAIRAKYNSMNNRISLEDSLTKQFITIGPEAIEHIQDPAEQQERLNHIITKVGTLLGGLRSDQIPILPHYVEMHHVDLTNTIPDNAGFLDAINADISAVMQVPRVAAGQERGSTFAATYNANIWSFQSIKRLQTVVAQHIRELFSRHLELLGLPHKLSGIPTLVFAPLLEESPAETMARGTSGFIGGVLTLNEAREIIGLEGVAGGDEIVQPEQEEESVEDENADE